MAEEEAEPRCTMGGLAGGELRVEVELPGCSAGDIDLEIQKRSGGGGLLLHLRVPGRFCLDRPLPPSIPLYTAVQTKFKSKTGKLAITLTVPPGAAAGEEAVAAPPSGGEDAAADGAAPRAEPPHFDEGRLVKPSEWDTLMAGDGDDPFAERERIDAELEAELSSMRRQFAGAAP